MTSIHLYFTALRPVVSSYPPLSRLLMPITVLPSSAIVALTWTRRFTIASSSDSSLHADRSSRRRASLLLHQRRINNREKSFLTCSEPLGVRRTHGFLPPIQHEEGRSGREL